ncbi:HTH domain-containing protein [Methanopyrus sp.]
MAHDDEIAVLTQSRLERVAKSRPRGDLWEFLKRAYEKGVKIDAGHLIILSVLEEANRLLDQLSKTVGEKRAKQILKEAGIYTKTGNYVSGELLKEYINRESRVAVHNRVKDLRKMGFKIDGKPGPDGGYSLIQVPKWYRKSSRED